MEPAISGVIIIDKPAKLTSHDVVDKLRKRTGIKKIGHTGTLDPMATGVMVMLIGKATRVAQYLTLEPKEYVAEVLFGLETDTLDITGAVVSDKPGLIEQADLEKLLPRFTGEVQQIPPMVSALKINGTPLYKLARKGQDVERQPRNVKIFSLELLYFGIDGGRSLARLKTVCSGGTYVRTLAHDIGQALDCGATLSALKRTGVGPYSLERAVDLTDIVDTDSLAARIIPLSEALSHLNRAVVDEAGERMVRHGNAIGREHVLEFYGVGADALLVNKTGAVIAIASTPEQEGIVSFQPKLVLI